MRLYKTRVRWYDGICLCIIEGSDEHAIRTRKVVITCRAIHPRVEGPNWVIDLINEMEGIPWQPHPNKRGSQIYTSIAETNDQEGIEDEEEVARREEFVEPLQEDEGESRQITEDAKTAHLADGTEWTRQMFITAKECAEEYIKGCIGCGFLQDII